MTSESVPPATPSSTVILARDGDGDDGLEVLMVRRHRDSAFGSADAFPGGRLDAADAEVHARCAGIDAREANRRLNVDTGALDYYSAALRELFEETGVLLARREHAYGLVDTDDPALVSVRRGLARGELNWLRFLRDRELMLEADALHYVSHWEAPLHIRPRFSTRFFVAVSPPAQQVRYDGRELVDSRWLSPHRAIEMGRGGDLNLPFPTMKNLESLVPFTGLAELIAWARDRWRRGVSNMRGVLVEENGMSRIVLPGEPGYPENEL